MTAASMPPTEVNHKMTAVQNENKSGDEGNRTPDIYLAKVALCQLSYVPALRFSGRQVIGFAHTASLQNSGSDAVLTRGPSAVSR